MKDVFMWLKAVRAPFFTASIIPVLIGTALSHREGIFNLSGLFFALVLVIAFHAGANLLNDYYDALGSDPINRSVTPFSGGSRLIQEGILSRTEYLKGAVVAYTFGLFLAIFLAVMKHNYYIFGIGTIGLILGVAYSTTVTFGMGRGWGELAVGLAFGPFPVLGSYVVQTNHLSWAAFTAGIPVGLLVMGILVLNEFPDFDADRMVGKRNWIVRTGDIRKGVWIYLSIISLAYFTVLVGVVKGFFPVRILFSYVTIPLAVWITLKIWRFKGIASELIPAMIGNVGLQFFTGLLICLGIW